MKILNEKKDNLPITAITSFISNGWEEVGLLKEQGEAIKKEFKSIPEVQEALDGVVTAYLNAIDLLQKVLENKKYISTKEN